MRSDSCFTVKVEGFVEGEGVGLLKMDAIACFDGEGGGFDCFELEALGDGPGSSTIMMSSSSSS